MHTGKLETDFEKCINAVDCLMKKQMLGETSPDPASDEERIATFMQQMIPHHENAVNMAKIILKQVTLTKLNPKPNPKPNPTPNPNPKPKPNRSLRPTSSARSRGAMRTTQTTWRARRAA